MLLYLLHLLDWEDLVNYRLVKQFNEPGLRVDRDFHHERDTNTGKPVTQLNFPRHINTFMEWFMIGYAYNDTEVLLLHKITSTSTSDKGTREILLCLSLVLVILLFIISL